MDWTWQAADGCIGKAPVGKKGAQATGRSPTDRGKAQRAPRSKRHLLADARGIPTALVITGANRHDMTQLAALLDGTVIAPAPTEPRRLALDRGDDDDACREAAAARGSTPPIPPKASAATPLPPPGHPERHPPRRGVVAVAHRWCNRFRRLLTRTDKQARHCLGFSHLAAIVIIDRKLRHARSLSR